MSRRRGGRGRSQNNPKGAAINTGTSASRIKGSRGGVGKPPWNESVTACDCSNNSDCTQGNNGQCVNCRCTYFADQIMRTTDATGLNPWACPPGCLCHSGYCDCTGIWC